MSEPMSRAEFDALADDAARDAAIARALDWLDVSRWRINPAHFTGRRRHEPEWARQLIPPFFTAGDDDPFARWDLLAEVWRRLEEDEPVNLYLDHDTWGDGAWYCIAVRHTNQPEALAKSPHRAACYALVDAGLVPKEESDV